MRMDVQTFGWFVFLALIKCYPASDPPFNLQPGMLTVKEGCCAAITCTFTRTVNNDDVHWFWMKDKSWNEEMKDFDATIVYSSNNSRRAVSPEFVDRVQIISSSRLQTQSWPVYSILICNLKKSDSGEYSFRFIGKNAKQKWVTKENVYLKVEENTCLLTFHKPPALNGSGLMTLTCSTSSSCPSNPEIQHLAQSLPTQQNHDKSTTVSFDAHPEDDGKVYSCQLPNNMDKYCIQNISITVEYGPKDIVAKVSKMEGVKEGDSVSLTCSAKGNPLPTISWFKEENKQSTEPDWRIESIKEPQSGQYHCEAENKHGKVKSTPFNIAVTYAPEVEIRKTSPMSVVREGDKMTLTCDLKRSNPQPDAYSWFKDKHKLNGREKTYSIVNTEPEHGGSYTCKAMNSVGPGESEPLEIMVEYRPRSTNISISGPVNNNRVKLGTSNIQLTCNTDANPSPNSYSWYRYNNKPADSSWWQSRIANERTLKLNNVERSDEACYICNATNSIGTGEDSVERCIHVLYPPTVPTLSMPGEVTEGQTITITCTVESNPASHFTLTRTSNFDIYKSDDYPPESNTLHHTFNITSEHSGSYICSAENSEGLKRSEESQLVVKYIPKEVMVKPKHGFEVNENKSLILDCTYKSYPQPSIKWMKTIDGKDKTLTTTRTLTIESVSPSDSGHYRCEATNDVGTGKSQSAEVKVRYAPKHTTILRAAEKQEHDGGSSIKLTCNSHAYPAVTYMWKWKSRGKENYETVSYGQNYTVHSNNPGAYYCIATNEIDQRPSEPVYLFERDIAMIVTVVVLCLITLFIIYALLLVYRRKKSLQQQTTNTQSSLDFLVWWRGPRGGGLRNENVLAEPFRSRDDLLPEQPFRLKAQRCQARPDSTPASNINTVYSTLNLPTGKPTPAAQKPTGRQGGHTQDESLSYASLHFWNKPKTKEAKGEEAVYAKVSKPNPLKKNEQERLEDYENVSVAHASKFPNPSYDDDDSDTSDDEVDVIYPRVALTTKPECQKDDTDSSTSDDDEIKYSDNDEVNEVDVDYTQVTFTPKPGHRRDDTDSSTSDDDEIQYSDVKL